MSYLRYLCLFAHILVYSMFPVSIFITPSVFSNVYYQYHIIILLSNRRHSL
jgi:hypothetical protein